MMLETNFLMWIPLLLYAAVIGYAIWLVLRLIRANERIADNTAMIAKALNEKNHQNLED